MRDVGQIRQYVWDFLDLEEEDLPASLIDAWVLEGWRKIVRRTRRWPFFESEWTGTATEGERELSVQGDDELDEIDTIEGPYGVLTYCDESQARNDYNVYHGVPTTGHPERWSLHAGTVRIYPTPDQAYEMRVVGWRQPNAEWMDDGTGAEPDMPEDLDDALLSWVMHRAYTHQDDPELAEMEKVRFVEAVDEMVSHHIQGPQAQPMVIGGARKRRTLFAGERPIPWGS
jgi:hypothetical protein